MAVGAGEDADKECQATKVFHCVLRLQILRQHMQIYA
jgi:hypothetical protein